LHIVKKSERVLTDSVALVYERIDRKAPLFANAEQFLGLYLYTFSIVEEHNCTVGRCQGSICVLRKVLMAWGVQEVDAEVLIFEVEHGRCDGDPSLLLHFEPVRCRMTI
tara:strand:+ start:6441 stop:6767 length:327 start_codon:yes stop_codon:yes gene_type:complete